MEHNCERHTFEVADGECRSCLGSFCVDCLLYPFGPDAPPYCKPCALTAGGIRSTARNPRRMERVAQTDTGSGGLLRRFRRSGGEVEEHVELTDDEKIELEAQEARRMLDAQRLPTEVEEDEQPEPTPTPNIAPPAAAEVDSELSHRSMPETIAGGLDLGDDPAAAEQVPMEGALDTAAPPDDRPAWARPDAAEAPSPSDPATESPAVAESPAVTEPAVAPTGAFDPTPLDTDNHTEPDVHAEPDTHADAAGMDSTSAAVTADGTALFATPSEPESEPEPKPDPEASSTTTTDAPTRALERAPVHSSLADMVEDTDELLRRIADLKGV